MDGFARENKQPLLEPAGIKQPLAPAIQFGIV
jgi:hypothetical protein